jgi:hypothetical protein
MSSLFFVSKIARNQTRPFQIKLSSIRTKNFVFARKAFGTAMAVTAHEKDQRPVFFFDIDNCVSGSSQDSSTKLTLFS